MLVEGGIHPGADGRSSFDFIQLSMEEKTHLNDMEFVFCIFMFQCV